MDWNQLFLEKEDWQHETFNAIKHKLFSAKNNRFIKYENTEENRLVMIYGKSQVGKTTLILNMIGLKNEYIYKVYKTLRAGVPKGNSCTSTAIIYSKSDNNQYGCCLSPINNISTEKIEYFNNDTDMINHLVEIRQKVESNNIDSNNILFLYIPNNYFINDANINNISIMDMPGVESRNHKEDIHVQNLMVKYIPISSVCIIACRSNEIQSLETTVLPNQMNWADMDHRFILVITHAYNDGTIKKYFQTNSSKREKSFYEYVKDTYTHEIRKILGENNHTEIYPIDIGDTLNSLCNDEVKSDNDKNEIIETKNRMLHELRTSIVNRKGERLKYALMNLKNIAEHYGDNELKNIEQEIPNYDKKIKNKNKLIDQKRKDSKDLTENVADVKKEKAYLDSKNKQFQSLLNNSIKNLPQKTVQYIINYQLYNIKKDEQYISDNKEQILSYLRRDITEQIKTFIENLIKLFKETNINIDINRSEIFLNADNYIYIEHDSLYPPKKGLFVKREKVLISTVEDICNNIQNNINDMLNSYVKQCTKKIKDALNEVDKDIKSIENIISSNKHIIKKYEDEIHDFKEKIDNLKEQKKEINEKKNQDNETLKMYLGYAYSAYMKQRNDIIKKINNSNSVDDKIMLIMFLGLLDKDFQKVTGGNYENIS